MLPPAVILAHGTSRRFAGGNGPTDKGLVLLGGQPLVAHAAARLAPQAGPLAINGPESYREIAGRLAATLLDDGPFAQLGPLAGIRAGLVWARALGGQASHLLVAPVDMPFLPGDLVARLAAGLHGDAAAIAASADGPTIPVLGLWPLSALQAVEAVLRGEGSLAVRAALDLVPWRAVAFSAEALAGIDDRAALAEAERRLAAGNRGIAGDRDAP